MKVTEKKRDELESSGVREALYSGCVLAVSDRADELSFIAYGLRRRGHAVVPVATLREAVDAAEGQSFHDPAADAALFASLKANLRKDIAVRELDCNINDALFAEACVDELLKHIAAKRA